MKTANKCPKCQSRNIGPNHKVLKMWRCMSSDDSVTGFDQSDLCRARCKVAKLKRQVNKLKERVEVAELAESALRNSNYVYNY